MESTDYELECPCGYHYWVSVFSEPEWEICPVCGLCMEFRLFLKEDNDVISRTDQQDVTSRIVS